MINFNKDNIIVASKYFTSNEIIKISELGYSNFGENRVSALLEKKLELADKNYVWHFIGHLQTNKIKILINEIDYLHSLSNIKQAILIQKYRIEPLKCMIQLNISMENSKNGIELDYLDDFIKELKKYDKIEVVGFMTIGILNNDIETNKVFKKANELLNKYNYPMLSMGMTNDYQLAINNNATHLRIGSYFKSVIGG